MKNLLVIAAIAAFILTGCSTVRSLWKEVSGTVDKTLATGQSTASNVVDVGVTPLK